MTNSRTPPLSSDQTNLFTQMGRLIVTWNDLDQLIRGLIFNIAMNDLMSVMILTADMNTSAAMTALRSLAVEHDAFELGLFKRRMADDERRDYVGPREMQYIAPHIQHFLDYVDRLREYRNFYAHGINSPNSDGGFLAQSRTARGRLALHSQIIEPSDLEAITDKIKGCIEYGTKLDTAIAQSSSYLQRPNTPSPTWPERPPLPDRLVKRRRILLDERDLVQPKQE